MTIIRGDNRQRIVPIALVRVLSVLIDEVDGPSHVRVELRTIRSRICRLYQLDDPQGIARDSDVAQALQEDDGIPQDDAL